MELLPDASTPPLAAGDPSTLTAERPAAAPAGLDRALTTGGLDPVAAVSTPDQVIDSAYALGPESGISPELLDRALSAGAEVRAQAPLPEGMERDPETGEPVIVVTGTRLQDPEAVERTLGVIRDELDDFAVGASDLRTIQRAIGDLSPSGATAVFERLRDDEVREIGVQLLDRTPFVAGPGPDGRSSFYTTLAERLDGTQLARFGATLDSIPTDATGTEGRRFGEAVSASAPEGARIGFVREAGAGVQNDPDLAAATAEVLVGLRGSSLRTALGSLSTPQFTSVLNASVTETVLPTPGTYHATYTYDASTAERLLGAVAASRDPQLQAAAVVAASESLATIEAGLGLGALGATKLQGPAPDQLRDGITAILSQNPRAVLGELANQRDREGRALTSYMASMLDAGRSAEVGRLIERLGTASGGQTPADWFTAVETDNHRGQTSQFANAYTMGYTVGAIQGGLHALGVSDRAQAQVVKDILSAGTGIVGGLGGPGGSALGAGVNGIGAQAIDALVDQRVQQYRNAGDAFASLAIPRVADVDRDGAPRSLEHSGAIGAYNNGRTAVGFDNAVR